MFLKRHSIALTAACAVAALLFAVVPVEAARGGGHGGGGYHGGGGGYHGGGWGGGGYHGGGWDRGGWGGFWPGVGIGIGLGGYGYGGYGGYGGYPYYNNYGYSNYSPNVIYTQPYYSTPSTTIVTPSYDTSVSQAAYAEPAAPDNRCRVDVRLPNPDAQVLFDGDATQQTGTDRAFASPPLTPGKTYTYTVEAKWMENGKPMDQIRSVTVTPNQTALVDFGR